MKLIARIQYRVPTPALAHALRTFRHRDFRLGVIAEVAAGLGSAVEYRPKG